MALHRLILASSLTTQKWNFPEKISDSDSFLISLINEADHFV
jgi:hypothetical protein